MKNLRRNFGNQKGFNLIELMIVIAIIGLLIGIGSYGWQAVMKAGNENAATQTVDKIRTLQMQYAGKNRGKFANFDSLIRSEGLDEKFQGERPVVNGYIFTMTIEEPSASKPAFYSVTADPQVAEGLQSTGTRHFYTDSSLGTLKATEENRPAKADDPSL